MAIESAARVDERSVESSASAVEWGAIFAGGIAAMGVTHPIDVGTRPGANRGISLVL